MPVRDIFELHSFYHIKNGSKNGKILWRNSVDFEKFMKTIVSYLLEFPQITLLAYVILPDQYQFVIQNNEKGYVLSDFIRKIQISYAMYYKHKYAGKIGKGEAVFPGRFVAKKLATTAELQEKEKQVHLSPVDLGVVKKISDWPYTSAHQVMKTGYKLQNGSIGETHIRVVG